MYEDIKENLITMFNEHKNKENHEFDNEFLIIYGPTFSLKK